MKRILMTGFVAAVLAGATVTAQPGGRGGMGGPPGMSAGMSKFFGDNKAFTATMEATMQAPSQSSSMTMEMNMFMLDGKIRVETDMSKIKGGGLPPSRIAQMKQMGMDKSVNIVRPDLKVSYNIFPGLQSYMLTKMTDKQVADAMDNSKMETTSLGRETIDGHPCDKNKVVVTGDQGEKHEVTVWNATDLKKFPIQMQMDENGSKMTMKYKDVKLEKPDAKLFDAPVSFTKYDTIPQMMQAEMMKKAGAGGAGAPAPK
jgi:hypothetical protein